MEDIKRFLLRSKTHKQWKRIGIHPHHGINLPLSALHSERSAGIGEFFDLLPIIDWCQDLNFDFIQLLPLNNSNLESDPSPYNAISSCALNFLYLSLHALPHIEKLPHLQSKIKELQKFNDTEKIAYAEVSSHKLGWLKEYCDAVGNQILKTQECKKFLKKNPWVKPYALFKALKNTLKNTSWKTWPEDYRSPTSKKLEVLYKLYQEELPFYFVLQFLCFKQLKEVREYANKKGIYLMGDIPILLSPESVDVWQYPQFFDTHLSAGAPPDKYNEEGQNWGFPLFNWESLRKSNFSWWKERLKVAENFFDIFRLDHVIGFFRIWAIPPHHPSKEGYYIPEEEKEWTPQGEELLSMIAASTSMLPIAEDLGTVPECVRPCLQSLGICGTKVMRWERNWGGDGRYTPYQDYPQISITCLSTHDMETVSLWWKEFPEEAKAFAAFKHWNYSPTLTLKQKEEILRDSHHTSSLFHVNLLQEYLSLFPELIHTHPEDERINIPGTTLPSNWTYRFKPSVEELISHKGLFDKVQQILA
jgi:4-alpha-glucanotransferase